MKTRITFTGIDSRTNFERLERLQVEYPYAEFGLLVAESRQGQEPRYPVLVNGPGSPPYSILRDLRHRTLNLSCHVCGSLARTIVRTGDFKHLSVALYGHLALFRRVQLNISTMGNLPEKIKFFNCGNKLEEIIIQQHPDRPLIAERVACSDAPVSMLLDASGGLGIEGTFSPVVSGFRTGYAGGLGPDNAAKKFKALKEDGAGDDFWIDMESGSRTEDWFDIDKVESVLESVKL